MLHRNIYILRNRNCLVTVFPCNLSLWRCLTFKRIYSSNNPNLLLGLWPFIYKTTEMFKKIISYFAVQFSYSFTFRNSDMKCSSISFCDNEILWCHPIAFLAKIFHNVLVCFDSFTKQNKSNFILTFKYKLLVFL